ncbi:hypothetical protein EUX98_g385 [Antrodiella citrinella]|uniref:holo-[acyl-carrier-protein] synthase n=1 Tax=Antrodiella citrinella TaxID=2447956 RepID=A0A4V3XJN8_9APHY|nr:hypothetical protein EUX98_g385 [Antrodiella citrinella]
MWQVRVVTFKSQDVDSFMSQDAMDTLDAESVARLQRYYRKEDTFLSASIDEPAIWDQDVPTLAEPIGYNVTHDNGVIAMAYASGDDLHSDPPSYKIGVDVMKASLPKRHTFKGFVEVFTEQLSVEEREILLGNPAVPEANGLRRFYLIWTLKEAYTKALGLGLGFEFKRISYDVLHDTVLIDGVAPDGWEFTRFELTLEEDSYVGVAARYFPDKVSRGGHVLRAAEQPNEWLRVIDAKSFLEKAVDKLRIYVNHHDHNHTLNSPCDHLKPLALCVLKSRTDVNTMNKRTGGEGISGLGGGIVSEASRKFLEIGEDLCSKRKPNEALPYLDKALKADPYNLDAYISLAFLAPDFDASVEVLLRAEQKGRTKLIEICGPRCFSDGGEQVGKFWNLIHTRPYMRVLQALVRMYVEKKNFTKAADTSIEMLRLCPPDNLGARYWLSTILVKANRAKDALYFCQLWYDPNSPDILPLGGCTFAEPSKAQLSGRTMQQISKSSTKASFLYDAALAAFKLWGACELASEYLLLAVRLNPIVLVKVLAKVQQQKTLNSAPREMNGAEDANDYLWLGQDLWMSPEVWNWASNQKLAVNVLLKQCERHGCGNREKTVAEFKRCAGCHKAWYCGQDCQKLDWKDHKKPCKADKKIKFLRTAMFAGQPVPVDSPVIGASLDFTSEGLVSQLYNA